MNTYYEWISPAIKNQSIFCKNDATIFFYFQSESQRSSNDKRHFTHFRLHTSNLCCAGEIGRRRVLILKLHFFLAPNMTYSNSSSKMSGKSNFYLFLFLFDNFICYSILLSENWLLICGKAYVLRECKTTWSWITRWGITKKIGYSKI